VLRPGNVTAPAGAVGILRRLLMMVRHFSPGVRIRSIFAAISLPAKPLFRSFTNNAG
jgi:hypothetical protein